MTAMSVIITDARTLLQDATAPYRYSDAALLGYANEGMERAIAKRPDLIFGSYSTAWVDKTLTDTFPFFSKYEAPISDFVIFRANVSDQEDASLQRGAAFVQAFEAAL